MPTRECVESLKMRLRFRANWRCSPIMLSWWYCTKEVNWSPEIRSWPWPVPMRQHCCSVRPPIMIRKAPITWPIRIGWLLVIFVWIKLSIKAMLRFVRIIWLIIGRCMVVCRWTWGMLPRPFRPMSCLSVITMASTTQLLMCSIFSMVVTCQLPLRVPDSICLRICRDSGTTAILHPGKVTFIPISMCRWTTGLSNRPTWLNVMNHSLITSITSLNYKIRGKRWLRNWIVLGGRWKRKTTFSVIQIGIGIDRQMHGIVCTSGTNTDSIPIAFIWPMSPIRWWSRLANSGLIDWLLMMTVNW